MNKAVAQGLSVIQGDAESDLDYYPDASVDVAILSQSLQMMHDPRAVLDNLLRIGSRAVVSVPNFGYWYNRFYLFLRGRMPVTKTLTYQWYDTPNIHFCTISDFVALCEEMGIRIERRVFVDKLGYPYSFRGRGWLANLFGEQGIFVLRKSKSNVNVTGVVPDNAEMDVALFDRFITASVPSDPPLKAAGVSCSGFGKPVFSGAFIFHFPYLCFEPEVAINLLHAAE